MNVTQMSPDLSPVELPEGYSFRAGDIDPRESVAVLIAAGLAPAGSTEHYVQHFTEAKDSEWDFEDVGVTDGVELVGYGTLMFGYNRAQLSNFGVRPEHQGQGIGRAIVAERVRRARARAEVRGVFVQHLEDTNALTPYYQELGFADDGEGGLALNLQSPPLLMRFVGTAWRAGASILRARR